MGRNTGLPERLRRYRITAGTDRARWPDDTGCGVLHVDMDAFFAAVELRTRPELRERPVVVAGEGPRSVVLSANYLAREFGVRSAMPVSTARRLCPKAVYLPPTKGLYGEVSKAVMAIFREVTPLVEPLSLDEAFLDVSGALRRLHSSPTLIGAEIRARVEAEQGIACSVGIAPVKFVAKLASGMAKPDGMVVVPAGELLDFLHPLPVSALWGVGERTNAALERAGLVTVADVAKTPLTRLQRVVGSAVGEHLHALSNGRDARPVVPHTPDKSIGAEHTFDVDQSDAAVLARELLRLSERVAASLRAKAVRGRTVSLKVRFSDFTTITRARSLSNPTDLAREIYACARALLRENTSPGTKVRLVGVRMDGLTANEGGQQLLLEDEAPKWREAEVAADAARTRFGRSAVGPATLLPWKDRRRDVRTPHSGEKPTSG